MTDDEIRDRLQTGQAALQAAKRVLQAHVTHCRHMGATWEQIGSALGVSRQAARERFGPRA